MDLTPTLLFIIVTFAIFASQTIALHRVNDFNVDSHGWGSNHKNWIWTGESAQLPNTSRIPSFYSDGNFYWSQISRTEDSSSQKKRFDLRINDVIIGDTKFYFRIWYYTTKPDEDHKLNIYIMNEVTRETGIYEFKPLATITNNSRDWEDVIVDCNVKNCCQWNPPTTTTWKRGTRRRKQNALTETSPSGSNCNVSMNIDIGIQLIGSTGEYSFAAIRCVSIGDNKCPTSHTTTTTYKTTQPATTASETATPITTTSTTSPETSRPITATTKTEPLFSSSSATTAVRELIATKKSSGSLNLPFTHDFKIGRHGWKLGNKSWVWTGKNDHSPNTTNIESFFHDGNFVWTKTTRQRSFGKHKKLRSPPISGVNNSTKFHFRYWFYSSKPTEKQGLLIYLDDVLSKPKKRLPLVTVSNSSSHWDDVTIDCQLMKCCEHYNCNLRIKVVALFGKSDGDGLVAIQCVSTEDNGCGPIPKPPVTTFPVNSTGQ